MLYLIKMELERIKPKKVLMTALLITLGVFVFLFLTILLMKLDPGEKAASLMHFPHLFNIIETLVGLAFIVYASVLLANIFVKAFQDNTISILFVYPLERTKLLWAKVMIVSILTFIMVFISSIVIGLCLYILSTILPFMDSIAPLADGALAEEALRLIVFSISCAGLALIPLFFGMLKKSVPATIVSSIIITFLLNSGGTGHTMASAISIPILLGIAGFIIAHFTIQRAVKMDIN